MTNMQNVENTSPYDILSNGIKKWVDKSQDIVSDIYNVALKGKSILEQKNSTNKDYRYVVDIPKSTLKLIENITVDKLNNKLKLNIKYKGSKILKEFIKCNQQ